MSISERYATAMLRVGVEQGVLDNLENDFTQFMKAYRQEEEFKKLFENPLIENKEKKEIIKSIIGEKNKELNNLFMLLVDRNREKELPFIFESFMDKVRGKKNRILCKAITAYKLNQEEKDKIAQMLKKQTQKEVELENTVDKSILGGIVIKVGDRVYDYSVKGQLNELRDILLKTSLAKVG